MRVLRAIGVGISAFAASVLLLAGTAVTAAAANPATLQAGFSQTVVASGSNFPTAFAFLPDGRILINEKHGLVRIYKNGTLLASPAIDITSKVNDYWDHGLLGIAVDPKFATNGYIYLLYTYEDDPNQYSGPKTARLSRFTMSGDSAAINTEFVVLGKTVGSSCTNFPAGTDCLSSDEPSHSVGNLKFDATGNLFVTIGDGASFNIVDELALRSQNLDLLTGKVLHVTPTGDGLPTNPFWNGSASSNRSKVWAYGVRNSFRFNVRPGSGIPYLGDVGWSTWEEQNAGVAGANLGWPCYEGAVQQPGYAAEAACQTLYNQGTSAVRMPLVPYNHNGGGAAAVGGVFYSGTTYPSKYQGAYFCADYAQSWIRYLYVDASNNITSGPFDFLYNADGPVDVELGPDGNIWYLSIVTGELRKITYQGTDTVAPSVSAVDPANGASSASIHTAITATLSELIDPSTVSNATVFLTGQSSGNPVSATVTYEGAGPSLTITPNSDLIQGFSYTVTIKGGASGIKDLNGNALASDFVSSFATASLPPPPAGSSFLSDLTWTSMTNGWGPVEKDLSNGEQLAGDGQPISIRGVKFAKGLGTHGPADVRYNLGAACSSFTATIGIDDEVAPAGSVLFQVWTDGVKQYDSGPVTGTMQGIPITVAVSGKTQLQLVVADSGSGFANAHSDWANAKISCGSTSGPNIASVTPADGSASAATNTPVTAVFSTDMSQASMSTLTFLLVKQGTTDALPATVTYNATNRTATLQASVSLAAGTAYVATVKGGASGVKDSGGTPMAADRSWTFTTVSTGASGPTYVSDLTWTSMTNGWGPVEKDQSNGEQAAGDGHTLSIRGTTFAKGLGAHGPSDVKYSVGGTCSTFTAKVGIDDEVAPFGTVLFQVWGDGIKLYDSGAVSGLMNPVNVNVSITGKNVLELVVADAGNGFSNAHADWADAQISCGTGGNTPPIPRITAPSSSFLWKVGDVISYAGSATDTQDGTIPASGLSWQIILHHCPGGACHIHPFSSGTGAGGSFVAPDHGDESFFELQLTAKDSAGLTAMASQTIQPQTLQFTLATSPSGLQVVYGGESGTSPMTRTTIVGSSHTISVPSPQGSLSFVSWSDGGTQQHAVVTGASNVTYTATFAAGTTGPTVTSTTPASGATAVAVNSPINAVFSTAMTASSITTSTFTVVAQGASTPTAATVAYDATTQTSTLTPTAALAAGITYTATVKGGSSGVKDSGGVAMAADRTWTFTTASASGTGTTFVSDLNWTSATNGWGPVEKDQSNGEQAAGDGHPLSIRGVTFAKGLGAHGPSDVKYNIAGTCSSFTATVGIDDEVAPFGVVLFQVWGDGVKLYDSGAVNGLMSGVSVTVPITGKSVLDLVVADAGSGFANAHADWANAKLTCQ